MAKTIRIERAEKESITVINYRDDSQQQNLAFSVTFNEDNFPEGHEKHDGYLKDFEEMIALFKKNGSLLQVTKLNDRKYKVSAVEGHEQCFGIVQRKYMSLGHLVEKDYTGTRKFKPVSYEMVA